MSSISHISVSSDDDSTTSSIPYIIFAGFRLRIDAPASDAETEPFKAPPSPDYTPAYDDTELLKTLA
ncbi:hypothetical protein Tco_0078221 [Tanacetum coccineum]